MLKKYINPDKQTVYTDLGKAYAVEEGSGKRRRGTWTVTFPDGQKVCILATANIVANDLKIIKNPAADVFRNLLDSGDFDVRANGKDLVFAKCRDWTIRESFDDGKYSVILHLDDDGLTLPKKGKDLIWSEPFGEKCIPEILDALSRQLVLTREEQVREKDRQLQAAENYARDYYESDDYSSGMEYGDLSVGPVYVDRDDEEDEDCCGVWVEDVEYFDYEDGCSPVYGDRDDEDCE